VTKREDRKREVEAEFVRAGVPPSKIERFTAITPFGDEPAFYACARSHHAVLRRAKEQKWTNVWIVEDDQDFIERIHIVHRNLPRFFELHPDFDVCMLCASPAEMHETPTGIKDDVVNRVTNANGACSYIVHERMYDRLLACWDECIPKLLETRQHWLWMHDIHWKKILQPTSQWFVFSPQLAHPRASFSDLAGEKTNHHNVLKPFAYSITLVTGYIPFGDLEPNTAHPSSHYLPAAKEMFDTSLPVYAFLHTSLADAFEEQRRRRGLADRTKIVRITTEDLPLMRYRDQLNKQREIYWPTRDRRSSASVHLMTCSKALLLSKAIEDDPFETAAFAWIDFGASRSAFESQKFEHALVLDRLKKENVPVDKVVVMAVNSVDRDLLDRVDAATKDESLLKQPPCTSPALREYYASYRYGFAGTFVTMGKDIGRLYCAEMLQVAERHIQVLGGHGEEMCLCLVHHRHPEWFEVTAGDYKQLFLNYRMPTLNTYHLAHVVRRFIETRHHKEATKLAQQIVAQHKCGVFSLPMPEWLSTPLRQALSLAVSSKTPIPPPPPLPPTLPPASEKVAEKQEKDEDRIVAWIGNDAEWSRFEANGSENKLAAQWACEWQPKLATIADRAMKLKPHVRRLQDLVTGWQSVRVPVKVDPGFLEMNASILPFGSASDRLIMAVRTRKYENYHGESRTRILVLSNDMEFKVQSDEPVAETFVDASFPYVGLEDPRLFSVSSDGKRLEFFATSLEDTRGQHQRTAVCSAERIEKDGGERGWRITNKRTVLPIRSIEKNWLPFVAPGPNLSDGKCVKCLYAIDHVHGGVVALCDPSSTPSTAKFQDSLLASQLVRAGELKWKGSAAPVWIADWSAWLCAVHVNDTDPTRGDHRFFATRFVLLERDGHCIRAYSEWFYVHHPMLEYVSGLCCETQPTAADELKQIIISYSVRDCETHVARFDMASMERLAWLSPRTNATRLIRLPLSRVFFPSSQKVTEPIVTSDYRHVSWTAAVTSKSATSVGINASDSSVSASKVVENKTKTGQWILHVTHYKERLEWLGRVPTTCRKIVVIHRGPSDKTSADYGVPASNKIDIDWRVQPNVGREGRSVFEYALELKAQKGSGVGTGMMADGDTIVFSQSDPDAHVPWAFPVHEFDRYASSPDPFVISTDPGMFREPGHLQQHHKYAQALNSQTMQPLPLTFAQFYELSLNRKYPTTGVRVSWCNAFAVTVERLMAHSTCFYTRMIETMEAPDPESGHAVERLMRSIFGGSRADFVPIAA